MTYIRACMSSKFGRIRPRTTELAALERLKKLILFILAGSEDVHKSLYEFEFRTDSTTDYGVSCP